MASRLARLLTLLLLAGAGFAAGRAAAALAVRLWLCTLLAQGPWEWFSLLLLSPRVLLCLAAAATLPLWLRLRARAGGGGRAGISLAGIGLIAALAPTAWILCADPWELGPRRDPFLAFNRLGVPAFQPHIRSVACRGGSCVVNRTNSLGMRGPVLTARRGAPRRLLLVGDSFVYGVGVGEEGTLHARLAEALRRRAPGRWEVMNVGMPGFNFHSYVRTLELLAPDLRPDAVVVGFLRGNDLLPYDVWDLHLLEGAGPRGLRLASETAWAQEELQVLLLKRHESWTMNPSLPPPEHARAAFASWLKRLLALRRRLGFRLYVFSYFGPEPLFDEAQASGALSVLVPAVPAWQSPDKPYAIPEDRHPTGEGNALFARTIAQALGGG